MFVSVLERQRVPSWKTRIITHLSGKGSYCGKMSFQVVAPTHFVLGSFLSWLNSTPWARDELDMSGERHT